MLIMINMLSVQEMEALKHKHTSSREDINTPSSLFKGIPRFGDMLDMNVTAAAVLMYFKAVGLLTDYYNY